ncbi:hypothetical protein FB107DRAFT_179604, partial [Schizophyllum commune]
IARVRDGLAPTITVSTQLDTADEKIRISPENRNCASFPHPPASMVNRLPLEILAQILLASLPGLWFRVQHFGMPLAVSHVCRFWRNICLNTPQMWQHVNLH